jgi:hypothetical protein
MIMISYWSVMAAAALMRCSSSWRVMLGPPGFEERKALVVAEHTSKWQGLPQGVCAG